ncbi:hypothetical protein ACFSC6_04690 [Rufibacter sediminis]|uniref:Uncharacterized protein n=1 Tax=Rufibacter sediminis TaxID=2762756 RepID=A0ABR6VS35_9BACT|nr:hypothetical protein [Rufibacter sediminis]MBC3539980.1 hypothetical protein [Rufibacter sediminis]
MRYMILLLLATTTVYSCNHKQDEKATAINAEQKQIVLAATDSTKNMLKSDSLDTKSSLSSNSSKDLKLIPKFEVEVRLSEAAETKLKSENETIIVGADFAGIPKDKSSDYYRHLGWIEVANAKMELRTSRTAVFKNLTYPKAIFDSISEKDFRVDIYVVSGRRSSQNNILDTDFISTRISKVGGKKIIVTGKLIAEMDSLESVIN